ncbi:hypothetical protein H4219_005294 [Mycoemilia scoparia]|uniref:Uncharacterized protein n=1 Tax=Mycoemilia scoparia TaxID=417184 RepID=A0A9W7ZV76_9FUNG|nr:hypothetical protein H4219_005294 [Mycoemilia scoparia]
MDILSLFHEAEKVHDYLWNEYDEFSALTRLILDPTADDIKTMKKRLENYQKHASDFNKKAKRYQDSAGSNTDIGASYNSDLRDMEDNVFGWVNELDDIVKTKVRNFGIKNKAMSKANRLAQRSSAAEIGTHYNDSDDIILEDIDLSDEIHQGQNNMLTHHNEKSSKGRFGYLNLFRVLQFKTKFSLLLLSIISILLALTSGTMGLSIVIDFAPTSKVEMIAGLSMCFQIVILIFIFVIHLEMYFKFALFVSRVKNRADQDPRKDILQNICRIGALAFNAFVDYNEFLAAL